jgi:hypothetical protein
MMLLFVCCVMSVVSASGGWFSDSGSTSTRTEDSPGDDPFSDLPSKIYSPEDNGCYKVDLDGDTVIVFSYGTGGWSNVALQSPSVNHFCPKQVIQITKTIDEIRVEFPVSTGCLGILNKMTKFALFPLTLHWNRVRNKFFSESLDFIPTKCPTQPVLIASSSTTTPTTETSTTRTTTTKMAQQDVSTYPTTSTFTNVIQEARQEDEPPVFRGSSNGAFRISSIPLFAWGLLIVFS